MIRSLIQNVVMVFASATLALTLVVSAPAHAATINVSGSSCTWVWDAPNQTLTCSSNSGGPASQFISFGAPPVGAVVATPVTISATASSGLSVTLTSLTPSVCQISGVTPTTVTPIAVGSCQIQASQPGNAAYAAANAQQSFNVSSQSGGGGTPSSSFCSQYSNVMPIVQITWGTFNRFLSSSDGGFIGNGVWVLQFTVPNSATPSTQPGRFNVAEYSDQPAARQLTISSSQCDFRFPDYHGISGPLTWSQGVGVTTWFNVVLPQNVGATGSTAGLVAGQTYYVNIRNWSADLGGVSCGYSTCNAFLDYQPTSP
jgi:hypothetical protein